MGRASVFLLWACLAGIAAGQDRKVTEVVKLLQDLLEKSKADGDSERNMYAKYKCYCDTNKANKEAEIARLTQEIEILEAKIEELKAANGDLSKDVAHLHKAMAQNEQDRNTAKAIRDKEHEAFLAKQADLRQAIDQMKDALRTLAEVGADQTMNEAQDHKQYMAGFEGPALMKLKSTINAALLVASSFVT